MYNLKDTLEIEKIRNQKLIDIFSNKSEIQSTRNVFITMNHKQDGGFWLEDNYWNLNDYERYCSLNDEDIKLYKIENIYCHGYDFELFVKIDSNYISEYLIASYIDKFAYEKYKIDGTFGTLIQNIIFYPILPEEILELQSE